MPYPKEKQKKNKILNEIENRFGLLFEDTNKFKCALIKEKRDGIKYENIISGI